MTDFWRTSGYGLLQRGEGDGLLPTDDFLRVYLNRAEVRPVAESCAAERALHRDLLDDPRLNVTAARLRGIADPDARENYEVLLLFRDRLLAHRSIEAAYLSLFREPPPVFPSMFVDQMAHVILRNILEGAADPLQARAAELLFRPQRVSIAEGRILVADEETVETRAVARPLEVATASLVAGPALERRIDLDVLDAETAHLYWARSDRFDTALDIAFSKPGLDAFCRVLEAWVRHLLGVVVRIQPVAQIRDERWVWHVGLDAEATAILNALYAGETLDEARLAQVLSLFRLEFEESADMLERVAGRPVYLALAQTSGGRLRVKPQNLLTNLPLAAGRGS